MISLKITSESAEEMCEVREKFHNALVGSPGYIDSEIAICEEPEDSKSFYLVVGNDAGNDNKIYSLNANSLVDLL